MNALRRVLDAPHPPPHYAVRLAYRTHLEELGWWHLNLELAGETLPAGSSQVRREVAERSYTDVTLGHVPHVCQ